MWIPLTIFSDNFPTHSTHFILNFKHLFIFLKQNTDLPYCNKSFTFTTMSVQILQIKKSENYVFACMSFFCYCWCFSCSSHGLKSLIFGTTLRYKMKEDRLHGKNVKHLYIYIYMILNVYIYVVWIITEKERETEQERDELTSTW